MYIFKYLQGAHSTFGMCLIYCAIWQQGVLNENNNMQIRCCEFWSEVKTLVLEMKWGKRQTKIDGTVFLLLSPRSVKKRLKFIFKS